MNNLPAGKPGQFYDWVSNTWVDGDAVIAENPFFKTHANGSVTIKVAGKYRLTGGIVRPDVEQSSMEDNEEK